MENIKPKESNEIEKIKVTSADIIVSGTVDKPYFEVKHYLLDSGKCCIGYSSYDLKTVFKWLEEYFDIVK